MHERDFPDRMDNYGNIPIQMNIAIRQNIRVPLKENIDQGSYLIKEHSDDFI